MKVYVVMGPTSIGPLHVCADQNDAHLKAKEVPHGTVWEREVEEPLTLYRVWVRFEEEGLSLSLERRMSIPMTYNTFEPIDSQNADGSITVEANSDDSAVIKAQNVLHEYVVNRPLRVTEFRRASQGGDAWKKSIM